MTPELEQAFATLASASELAPLPRQGHIAVQKATEIVGKALASLPAPAAASALPTGLELVPDHDDGA